MPIIQHVSGQWFDHKHLQPLGKKSQTLTRKKRKGDKTKNETTESVCGKTLLDLSHMTGTSDKNDTSRSRTIMLTIMGKKLKSDKNFITLWPHIINTRHLCSIQQFCNFFSLSLNKKNPKHALCSHSVICRDKKDIWPYYCCYFSKWLLMMMFACGDGGGISPAQHPTVVWSWWYLL